MGSTAGLAGLGGLPVLGFDWNPLNWEGDAAAAAAGAGWRAAMIGLWSCGLWLLKLAFQITDMFTTPDLSGSGPMGAALPITLWLGGFVAVLMMLAQLAVALVRRDGQSLGRILLGVGQFGLVWVGYLGVAAGLAVAAGGLERGILQAMLHVDVMSAVDMTSSWPRQVGDATVATVLGVLSLLLLIPAALFYIVIAFVRAAALIILVATAPISAAGLVNDTTKVWFWKSLRWFIACLLISPGMALVLGIGEKLSAGIVAGDGDQTTAAAGMAVIGAVIIAIGSCCPLVLFRLLAFVEPGTSSGSVLRQSWSDAGGLAGMMPGGAGKQSGGSSAAAQSGSDGRSGGEAGAESQTQSRLTSMLGPVGNAIGKATAMAGRATDIGSDVLNQAGVGTPGYGTGPPEQRGEGTSSSGQRPQADGDSGSGGDDSTGGDKQPPTAPEPPAPPTPPAPLGGGGGPGELPPGGTGDGGGLPGGLPPGGGNGGGPAGGGAAGEAGGGAGGGIGAEAAMVAL